MDPLGGKSAHLPSRTTGPTIAEPPLQIPAFFGVSWLQLGWSGHVPIPPAMEAGKGHAEGKEIGTANESLAMLVRIRQLLFFALSRRDAAARRMTPAQIAEAEKLVREWKPKPER